MTSEQTVTIKNETFLVLPEYYGTIDKIIRRARQEQVNIIGGYSNSKETGVVLVDNGGLVIARRTKARLVRAEQLNNTQVGTVSLFKFKDITILSIICYEIVYPIDYYHFNEKIDLITHHVYSPMFDIYQYEGFRALEQAVGQHYKYPVVVSCGNPPSSPCQEKIFNLSKIIYPNETEEFTNEKFDQYRRYGF